MVLLIANQSLEKNMKRSQEIFMAICTGLIVANIYYSQPLIPLIAKEFGIAESQAGEITFLNQLGYALGILFFVPVGDLIERRKLIMAVTFICVGSLAATTFANQFWLLAIASVFVGVTSVVPQMIIPMAAALASPEKRGKVIGNVMSGLLIGILLSRTLSGIVGAHFGWRGMYGLATIITLIQLPLMYFFFPVSQPAFKGTYGKLMKSLFEMFKYDELREATLLSGSAFACFGMFWTGMVLWLSSSAFGLNSDTIGLFGLAGALGALFAPLAGRSADKRHPRKAIGLGIFILILSFVIFYIFRFSIIGICFGIITLDFAMQAIHVSNQTRVYAILPEARNRLNTIYMTGAFIGTASGSALALIVWKHGSWPGICLTGVVVTVLAAGLFVATKKRYVKAAA
jgi:predicted MFS family arabinose efflux permease